MVATNSQPNQEDAELREKLMHVFSQHRLVERGRTVSPSDMDAFVQLFHAELEAREKAQLSKDNKEQPHV